MDVLGTLQQTPVAVGLSLLLWLGYAWIAVHRQQRIRGGGLGQRAAVPLNWLFAVALALQAFFSGITLLGRDLALSAPSRPSSLTGGSSDPGNLVLALQWTPGVCFGGVSRYGRYCKDCFRNDWTIHGLWPPMSYCADADSNFGVEGLDLTSMKASWPSCFNSDESFWRYQWRKHGTCMAQLRPDVQTAAKYFHDTLALYQAAEIYRRLYDAGIWPKKGHLYDYESIKQALEGERNATIFVNCDQRVGKGYVLTEIRLCYDSDYVPRNCPPSRSHCSSQVFYEPV